MKGARSCYGSKSVPEPLRAVTGICPLVEPLSRTTLPSELMELLFVTPFLSGFGKMGLELCSVLGFSKSLVRAGFLCTGSCSEEGEPTRCTQAVLPVITPNLLLCSKHGSLPLICALWSPIPLPFPFHFLLEIRSRQKSGLKSGASRVLCCKITSLFFRSSKSHAEASCKAQERRKRAGSAGESCSMPLCIEHSNFHNSGQIFLC